MCSEDYSILHLYQQCMTDPVFHILPAPGVVTIIKSLLELYTGTVALICICLVANDIEHIIMCLFALCMSS